MTLTTERLILREMTMDDYGALYAVLSDSDIMQHYPYSFDENRVRGWISRNIERYRIFGFGLWAVCLKESGEMIGDCGLTMQDIGGVIRPEIGYHIRKDMQRKGYASEAAAAVRNWTFCNTTFNEIFSYMKYTNEPSARTAMSWGCTKTEEFADEVNEKTLVYSITKEQWQNGFQIVRLSDRQELKEKAAEWFSSKWGIPKDEYMESIEKSFSEKIPQWYVCLDGNRIAAGMGVIDNDYHARKDLSPNVCAVYTDIAYRRMGHAGRMLDFVCEDMAERGVETLYLITGHEGFYERYGWEFFCMALGDGDKEPSRIYVHYRK